jgi:hypothetical protein
VSEQAKRVAGFDECFVGSHLGEGELCYWKTENDGWYLNLPGCGLATLRAHMVEEHEDGTISATPSILVTSRRDGKNVQRHGYLTHGVWTEC